MIAMILAAGRGERLRPITDATPKAMVSVRGEPLIDRHLHMLAAAGMKTVVINLGWLGEQISEHVGSGSRYGLQVVYSPEYDNILETGGGIHRALPMLGNKPFWVVNADVFTAWQPPAGDLQDDAIGELVLVPIPAHKERGDFSLENGLIGNNGPRSCTFSGIARYRPEFFAGAESGRYSIVPMMRAAADEGTLSGSLYEGLWEDVGTAARLQQLNSR
ncbi:MAG: MurNAc alpha-1-phosphate uridylyltransferase [Woeseiaceae bacterium]|jgi:MurNAc alpha-1-phosphate uridylyltransferase